MQPTLLTDLVLSCLSERCRQAGDAMLGHRISLKGFTVKDGKVVRNERRLDVSARVRLRRSKRVRVVRPGATQ